MSILLHTWFTSFHAFVFCPWRTERDVTNWSSDKLKELLSGVRVESEEGSCGVTEVSKVEGEASINNRKGKLIFFYEWDVQATWKGEALGWGKLAGEI